MSQLPVQRVQVSPHVRELRAYFANERVMEQISKALPRHLTAERMVRQVMTLVQTTPALERCRPDSIYRGVIKAAELGLELSGPLGHCYLVPRKGEATFQIGYRGMIELAHRSGRVQYLTARVVYEGEPFEVMYGTEHRIRHEPFPPDAVANLAERLPLGVAYYAVVKFLHGGVDFEVMWRAQADAHRRRFAASEKGPWGTDFDAMALKTVIKKLSKRCPLSTEYMEALASDEEEEAQPAPGRAQVVLERLDAREAVPDPDELMAAPAEDQPPAPG